MLKIFTIFILSAFLLSAQEKEERKDGEKKYEMKQYFLVLLKRGPNAASIDSAALQEIQRGHMAHIEKMADEKKLVVAGPFGDDTDLRGIFIFDVATMDEAVELTNADPAVKAGRLEMEIHPWWTARGTCLP